MDQNVQSQNCGLKRTDSYMAVPRGTKELTGYDLVKATAVWHLGPTYISLCTHIHPNPIHDAEISNGRHMLITYRHTSCDDPVFRIGCSTPLRFLGLQYPSDTVSNTYPLPFRYRFKYPSPLQTQNLM